MGRRCNDGGLVPEEEGGGEEARPKGCCPSFLQEVHQEADPSWAPHLFTHLVCFGSRHLCTSWSCCRRGFTPAFTPSPPPSSSAKGWGQVGRLKTSEASHRHKLGQSQTMEESKKSTNRGNLNFLKVPQTKRPSMRDLPDTEKNYFLEKCSIKENLSTTSGQNVFCLKPSTTENIFML